MGYPTVVDGCYNEVSPMAADCLKIPLDPERRQKLELLVAVRAVPAAVVVCELIDQAYEADRAERLRLVHEMAQLQLEDVPDPDELSRQLDSTYDVPDPYAVPNPD